MGHFNKELKKNFVGFTPAAAELLQKYPWPGNIRELRNVIERTMILCRENEIGEEDLPEELRDYHEEPAPDGTAVAMDVSPTGDQFVTFERTEDRYISEVLTHRAEQDPRRAHSRHPSHLAAAAAEEDPSSSA